MRRLWFWVHWSLRDLRKRWVQVAVIALVIAIGAGVYAGLSSSMDWRRLSYDASYKSLRAHDLRVKLSADSYVTEGTLRSALASLKDPDSVEESEERLIVPTQVEARAPDKTALVAGRIVGVAAREGGPKVDGIKVTAGESLAGEAGAVLEKHFADQYELPAHGTITLAGGVPLSYSGIGLSPEYFMVTSGQGDFLSQGEFAAVFVPLPTAQKYAGREGLVNDMVIRLAPGADREAAQKEVEAAMAAELPNVGTEVETIEDDPAYNLLYQDLNNDRGTIFAIAFLVLLAAAFASFTLTSRIVEAERREIGIDMALGVPRGTIAIRPLLGGAWIAALGIVFGIGIGFLFAALLRSVFVDIFPLPVWLTPLEAGPFLVAAAIGFILPFAATAWPVWRAVRVEPVQAIRTGHLAAKGGGLAPLIKRLHLPGKSLAQIPFRNVMRAPRRTILTAIGIGAAMVTLVVVAGSLDSFNATLTRVSTEVKSGATDRLVVTLAGFEPDSSELVRAIKATPSIGEAETDIVLGASVTGPRKDLRVQLQAMDLDSAIWHPAVESPADAGNLPGIVLSSKAARDIGVSPGDTVDVKHPQRTGSSLFGVRTTKMRVTGEHPNPMRFLAYTDISNAGVFGLEGMTDQLQVVPAGGSSIADVKRDLFKMQGIAVVQDPAATVDLTKDQLSSFMGIFRVVEAFALFLALLMAFNAASIGTDERSRENATMMAYGVRVKTLLRMSIQEGVVIGILGTLIGLGLGVIALNWLIARSAATIPELELLVSLKPATIVSVLVFGVLVVGLAPLLTARKLLRTDVPSTLRVME